MGTRALILVNSKPIIAPHWNGYPTSLGMELLECEKTPSEYSNRI